MKSINVVFEGKLKLFLFVMGSVFMLAFNADHLYKNDYVLSVSASAVCIDDLDLDGDNDVIVGHYYDFDHNWGGVTILKNDGYGQLQKEDSLYIWRKFCFVNMRFK